MESTSRLSPSLSVNPLLSMCLKSSKGRQAVQVYLSHHAGVGSVQRVIFQFAAKRGNSWQVAWTSLKQTNKHTLRAIQISDAMHL